MVRDQSPAATAGSAPPDARPSLSWAVTPETNRLLHLLSYGLVAPLGAVALVLFGGAVGFAAVSIREGSWAVVLALGALVVVALARPPVLAAILSDETEASFSDDDWTPSRPGLLAASVLCGGAMLLASLHSWIAMGVVAALSFAAGLLAMTLRTDAEIDTTVDGDLRLETQYAAANLTTLSGVHSLDFGGVTVLWLSYARGADGFRNPRVLAASREQADEVRERLDAGVDAPADADPMGHAERTVVALFGLGVLATGPALWLLLGDAADGGVLVAAYATSFSMLFAAPMLWYALKG